jgi:putative transposase
VRAKMSSKPEEWKWSSYRYTAGINKAPVYLTTDWIIGLFSKNKNEAQKLYRRFVKEGIGINSPWEELQGQIILGGETFIEKYKDFLHDKKQIKEIPRIQRYLNRPKLADLFSMGYRKAERNKRIHAAHVKYGYRLNEIAEYMGIHYSTVSKAIKNEENNCHFKT